MKECATFASPCPLAPRSPFNGIIAMKDHQGSTKRQNSVYSTTKSSSSYTRIQNQRLHKKQLQRNICKGRRGEPRANAFSARQTWVVSVAPPSTTLDVAKEIKAYADTGVTNSLVRLWQTYYLIRILRVLVADNRHSVDDRRPHRRTVVTSRCALCRDIYILHLACR